MYQQSYLRPEVPCFHYMAVLKARCCLHFLALRHLSPGWGHQYNLYSILRLRMIYKVSYMRKVCRVLLYLQ